MQYSIKMVHKLTKGLKELCVSPFFRSTTFRIQVRSFFSIPTQILSKENKGNAPCSSNHLYKIDLVDDDIWNVSSGLAEAWRINNNSTPNAGIEEDEVMEYLPPNKDNPDLDEIEDMRIRGNLFYKLERHSKEYEDHKFDFHRRKPLEKNNHYKEDKVQKKDNKCSALLSGVENQVKSSKRRNEITNKETSKFKSLSLEDHSQNQDLGLPSIMGQEKVGFSHKNACTISRFDEVDACNTKSKRTPTFNQVTAPYHEPFCLDIYVSKGSVRASVIHRVTSKVVAVAHSISKDLKFDLGSPKSRNACALVGKVLAQRAVDDDIHNMVYTPRKGEKLEGKLQIVLQAIIDGGIEVKVKLKQKKARKTHGSIVRTHH